MKTLFLIATITLGVLFPFTHKYSFLIKYLLMLMLFFSFLSMDVKREHFHKSHFLILIINIGIPLIAFLILRKLSLELATVVFITGIAPTAIAAPIIVNLLGRQIEHVVISILITNFSVALLLPFLMPVLFKGNSGLTFSSVLIPVVTVFFIPFAFAEIIKRGFPILLNRLKTLSKYVFYILVININLGTSKASYYIREEMSFYDIIIYEIAIASLVLCILNFSIGMKISSSKYSIECSQSLGQKNNGFTVWVALAFVSPLAVLGPVFYILFQNIYISWQLHKSGERN